MMERILGEIRKALNSKSKAANITATETNHIGDTTKMVYEAPKSDLPEDLYPLGGQMVKWDELGQLLQYKYTKLGLGPKSPIDNTGQTG